MLQRENCTISLMCASNCVSKRITLRHNCTFCVASRFIYYTWAKKWVGGVAQRLTALVWSKKLTDVVSGYNLDG